MKTIIQILGPTGVGKSGFALSMAKKIRGEIISADSMQVYKGFDIGTDKVSPDDRKEIPHHLIDIYSNCEQFNASVFLKECQKAVGIIETADRIPIVCGGTALYLRVMIQGIFPESEKKRISRDRLNNIFEEKGIGYMWERLNRIDSDYAKKIGKNDRIRIIRGLEIFYNNKIKPTDIFQKSETPFSQYRFIRIGLNMRRDILYKRINLRVEKMMERGMVEEVKKMCQICSPCCPPFQSLGYKEVLMMLNETITKEEMVPMIQQRTRQFAKRQLSWFRQEKDIHWFHPDQLHEVFLFVQKRMLP